MIVGAVVLANVHGLGLPYKAIVEELRDDRVKIRPLHGVLTEGSARHEKHRKGPSIRARWVKLASVEETRPVF